MRILKEGNVMGEIATVKNNRWDELPIILGVDDVQKILRISRATAYRLMNRPGFPARRVGDRRIVIPRDAFRKWLESGDVE